MPSVYRSLGGRKGLRGVRFEGREDEEGGSKPVYRIRFA
jgi:hypothetical protein